MNVVVLGGTGACEKHFVNNALNRGHVVRLLTRRPENITVECFLWADHEKFGNYKR